VLLSLPFVNLSLSSQSSDSSISSFNNILCSFCKECGYRLYSLLLTSPYVLLFGGRKWFERDKESEEESNIRKRREERNLRNEKKRSERDQREKIIKDEIDKKKCNLLENLFKIKENINNIRNAKERGNNDDEKIGINENNEYENVLIKFDRLKNEIYSCSYDNHVKRKLIKLKELRKKYVVQKQIKFELESKILSDLNDYSFADENYENINLQDDYNYKFSSLLISDCHEFFCHIPISFFIPLFDEYSSLSSDLFSFSLSEKSNIRTPDPFEFLCYYLQKEVKINSFQKKKKEKRFN
jgi:hypothetical protein